MRLKGLFWILTGLLVALLAVVTWYVFYHFSFRIFVAVEALVVLTAVYLLYFYRSIIKPLQIIGDGMDLLREQDFSSRLRDVGQPEADRIVSVFNKMMEQLKNERLYLREQNHFLDLLVNASPLGVVILDLDGRVRSVNPAGIRLFGGQSEGDFLSRPLSAFASPLARELSLMDDYGSRTIRLSDANIYKCTYSSFIDKGFQHPFYLVEPLTEEVFKAEKKAYEKVIRMIAHEVNNTTAGITSTLDTLDTGFRGMEDMADVSEALQVAIERCYSMSRFITRFADVVRIPEPQLQRRDLNALVVACQRFMEHICNDRDIRIVRCLSDEPPLVEIDALLFEQVLVNIIKNSAESIGHGGEITIRTTASPATLEVADTGQGIDPETQSRLFSPFFSTKPHGQGLGLIFIREVLQKHGFTFSLRTDPDGLTRFRIHL